MIKDAFTAIGGATRELLRDRGALGVLAALYLLLLVAVGAERAPEVVRRALRDFLKILLVSLPLVALAVLVYYLLNKLQARFPVPPEEATRFAPPVASYRAAPPPMSLHWQDVTFSALRLLLLGAVLPLAAIHLWLAVARGGLKAALGNAHRVLARAFAPRAVLVYAVGLFLFGLTPYFVVYTTTPVKNGWAELTIFGLRLAVAFVLTIGGWAVTLGALARLAPGGATASADAAPAPTPPREELPTQASAA